MTLRKPNSDALQAHHPEVARALSDLPEAPEAVQILETRSGEPTAVRHGLTLHSRHDPRGEAERLAARELQETPSAVIVMGFGLGYTVEAVRRKFPEMPILVLEPDGQMFQAALSARHLGEILSDERILFHVAGKPQEVTSFLRSLPLAKPA
ncbi:MAG TPA: hypothetical protein VMM82_01050, partial [Spirochaetia bacterium]|nr:hypothetical protein [Spirochaetia bacterium]